STSSGVGGAGATFTALAITGAGSLDLSPLASTGFLNTSVPFDLPADSTLLFAVDHGGGAPIVTAGPVIFHLSDTSVSIGWTTNRESTSIVEFGPGALTDSAEDATLTTDHLVTLTGLIPGTSYS